MPGSIKKEDLRIQKTYNALMASMSSLLEERSFSQITVNNLCEEAQISRATFYAHFVDKYDLLKHWLDKQKFALISSHNMAEAIHNEKYEVFEKEINNLLYGNINVFRNLIGNMNQETFVLLCDFMLTLFGINATASEDRKKDRKYIVFSQLFFLAIMTYFLWHVKNKFPTDLQIVNTYFYDIVNILLKWYDEVE